MQTSFLWPFTRVAVLSPYAPNFYMPTVLLSCTKPKKCSQNAVSFHPEMGVVQFCGPSTNMTVGLCSKTRIISFIFYKLPDSFRLQFSSKHEPNYS